MVQKKRRTGRVTPWAFVAFFIMLVVCLVPVFASGYNKSRGDKIMLASLMATKGDKVAEVVAYPLYKAYTLSSYIVQQNGDISGFEELAATMVTEPWILNVLAAPGGVVEKVYPLQGNEALVGFDLLSEDAAGNEEARIALQKRKLVMGGPFTLTQGGQGIVGRLPVFMLDEDGQEYFWGLVSVTLQYPDVLVGAGLETLERQGLQYELWRTNPDDGKRQRIAGTTPEENSPYGYYEKELDMMGAQWFFRVSPVREWYHYPYTWVLAGAGALIALLVAFLVQDNYVLKRMKSSLESMVHRDALTGALNRQGLFFELERLVRLNKAFYVYFLDLNDFKQVNDTYGHQVGDRVLREFADRVDRQTDGSHIFARISGDEFVVAHVDESLQAENMRAFWQRVDKAFETPVYSEDGKEVMLTYSRGMAVYPLDAENLDELLFKADQKMYEEKRRVKRAAAATRG